MTASVRRTARAVAEGWAPAARWRAASVAVVLAVLWLGKAFYSGASAEALRWMLAPTARLVSWASGAAFVYERGAGWISQQHAFLIAPACAGVNFALAAYLVLMLAGLPRICSGRSMVGRLMATAAIAYLATLLVNTVRIVIAMALHRGLFDFGASAADVHRAEGILVYLTGLCVLFAAAQAEARRDLGPPSPRGGDHVSAA